MRASRSTWTSRGRCEVSEEIATTDVKRVREATGLGYREAVRRIRELESQGYPVKAAVEALVRQGPSV